MKEFIKRCREWQKQNPEWELICDIKDSDKLYVQWSELRRRERMSWIGQYKESAREMFEEFGRKNCKVECRVLDNDMCLHDPANWPAGNAMTVFLTSINGVKIVDY